MDPPFLSDPLDDGEDQDDQEQRPGNRRGIPHLVIAEGVLIDEQGQHGGAVSGTALGNRLNDPELLDRHDQTCHKQQEGSRADERPDDVTDGLPGAGSVDFGGFQEFSGDFLQGGQVDDHVVAKHEPDPDDVDGEHRCLRGCQPSRRMGDADRPQQPVDRSVRRLEQQHPDEGHGDAAGDIGHEIQRPQQLLQMHGAVKDHRDDKGQPDGYRHGQEKDQGVF